MTKKRLILIGFTIVVLITVLLNLLGSLNQPQVQANLQIYQTDLILQASELNFDRFSGKNSTTDLGDLRSSLLGKDPYLQAGNQYAEARKASQKNLSNLQSQLETLSAQLLPESTNEKEEKELKKQIRREKANIDQISLKLGIIKAQQEKTDEAMGIWMSLIMLDKPQKNQKSIQETATILAELWSQPPQILPDTESTVKNNLNGWFRYRILQKKYQIENRQNELFNLQEKEQKMAMRALLKLTVLSAIPVLGGILGFGILLFLLIQLLIKKEQSVLAVNSNVPWQTPWPVETTWQVLIIGFFWLGQILLPFGFSGLQILVKFDFTDLSLRGKAIYILFNYLSMAVGGLLVLYLSIKSFFPLNKDWFRCRWLSNWFRWGMGGYLVALPLVLVISLINQQLWDGQGGSNPLLFLALEAQDWVVLGIFFFTAAVAAPIYEEIMFRGFLLPSLTPYMPVRGAILISGIVFAIAHLNLSEVLPLVVLGIVLGVVYTRTRNLLASILLHSLWNSGTLLSLFILGSGRS